MGQVLLSPAQMARADALTIAAGTAGFTLMQRAGKALAAQGEKMLGCGGRFVVVCGPGNNGGDGLIASAVLRELGYRVEVLLVCAPDALTGDAALALAQWSEAVLPIGSAAGSLAKLTQNDVVIDALFGAGLVRPIEGALAELVASINASNAKVVACDLPSGVDGLSGQVLGCAVEVDASLSFFRGKPGHYLLPGASLCGEVHLADIGIDAGVLDQIQPMVRRVDCEDVCALLRVPPVEAHKFSRGHVAVFSGGVLQCGAARLAARAAQRCGAGVVTLVGDEASALLHAHHETSIMTAALLERADKVPELIGWLAARRVQSVVIGPGFGVGRRCREMVAAVLSADVAVVLDADALTSFANDPQTLFALIADRASGKPVVLTPHHGEIQALFGQLIPQLGQGYCNKLEICKTAARLSGAIVLYKGPDTVIGAPDGRLAICDAGVPWLATAGAGDVLCGVIAAFLAQGADGQKAAAAGAYVHGRAGAHAGAFLVAEELVCALKPVLVDVRDTAEQT
ncbi:bifunctional ADP-dependent NAD(P)H-hydrate dehydratase/NAD(P)H-hydrate epimerase [Polycladidibacter hongkongensis]|uniref:bifunctional ADP-dependent NAD(P)H-hydrate dehydratase/NAD(P)H-hydrate epimerase n=1 Tax=Polycladidibacter hongkongensis TaxID=1647556 RepID=UPI00082FCFDF|nr:bifunctional ADP-dependent NAD(P)H-hydrate dehydratase/NAD(P)H-hydrate epimerase [Pseudovibrio hongkongensis]